MDSMTITDQDLQNPWFQVGQQFANDVPDFIAAWNCVVGNSQPWQVHPNTNPVARLMGYMRSLMEVSQQALYSTDMIKKFNDKDRSNITNWYVSFYFYNFIVRVKTATDLLALIIRHIFCIDNTKLKDEQCSLHKNNIIGILRNDNPTLQQKNLAKILENARKDWIKDFYPLRNLVIHQPGLLFIHAYDTEIKWTQGSQITVPFPYKEISSLKSVDRSYPLSALEPLADAGEPLSVFLRTIKSMSIHPDFIIIVDPTILCDEIWALLSQVINKVFKEF